MKRADIPCRRVPRKPNPLWPLLAVVALLWLAGVVGSADEAAKAKDQLAEQASKREAAKEVEWVDLDKVGRYLTAFDQIKEDRKNDQHFRPEEARR